MQNSQCFAQRQALMFTSVGRVSARAPKNASNRLVGRVGKREVLLSQVKVFGKSIRVAVWPADEKTIPLLLFNGIGASLELLVPFADAMGNREIVTFDVPGTGESETTILPYRMWMLAMLAGGLLDQLGYGQVDALGVSWGGVVAQQFALQNPRRCRKLILAATSPGVLMVPPKLSVLTKFMTPKRFNDANYRKEIAGEIYGGKARTNKSSVEEFRKASKRGYLYQQLTLIGWTSVPWLAFLRQPTLIMAGDDDPVIHLANAKILTGLIRDSRLHVVADGHLFLISSAEDAAEEISNFLGSDRRD